jgi:hypothetical protein
VVCDWGHVIMIIYPENIVCECYVWMEGGDKSGQARLLTFDTISGSRMRELGPGSS